MWVLYSLMLSLLPVLCSSLGRTLDDCRSVAGSFRNTCGNDSAISLSSMIGEDISCDNVGNCVGNEQGSTCTWTRKLCVTCSEVNNDVKIRIQSNGLPGNCYSIPQVVTMTETEIDFEVKFNPEIDSQNPRNVATTQSELDQLVCDITNHRDSNIPSENDFIKYSSVQSMRTIVGISVDGVAILNAISVEGVDPFYPTIQTDVEKVDLCLGHPRGSDNLYHYHMPSPCMYTTAVYQSSPCSSVTSCSQNFSEYSMSAVTDSNKNKILGISKDGHVIKAPFLQTGESISNELDICNGGYNLECDNSYYYYATNTFPYFVGCFGGGNYPVGGLVPSCSDNTKQYQQPVTQCVGSPSPPQVNNTNSNSTNIIIFMPDDMDFIWDEAPPGYDVPGVHNIPETPFINSIRDDGITFKRAYTASPKCAPSRFSLLTGRHSSAGLEAIRLTQRSYSGNSDWDGRTYVEVPTTKMTSTDSDENIQTALQSAGYYTIHSGKWHIFPGSSTDDYLNDYDRLVADVQNTGFDHVAGCYVSNMPNNGVTVQQMTYSHNLEWMVSESISAIDVAISRSAPFFLHFTPTAPHTPNTVKALKISDLMTPSGILLSSPVTTMRSRSQLLSDYPKGGRGNRNRLISHAWVDDSMGALLQAVDDRGLTDNTMVIFCIDHGMGAKSQLYEGGVRIALSIKLPSMIPKGISTNAVVSNIDIPATLLELTGLSESDDVSGESFLQVLKGQSQTNVRPKVSEIAFDRSIVAGRYKYIHRSALNEHSVSLPQYPSYDDCEQLYDLSIDGAEQNNLAIGNSSSSILSVFRTYIACHDSDTCELPIISEELLDVETYLENYVSSSQSSSATPQCDPL